jgi:hypothetical protein
MFSVRECVLLDLRAAGSALCYQYPEESVRPGWLQGTLQNLCVWLIGSVPPDLREAAIVMFPTLLALYPTSTGDASLTPILKRALADTFALAGPLAGLDDAPEVEPIAPPTVAAVQPRAYA